MATGVVTIPAYVVTCDYTTLDGVRYGWMEVDIASRDHHHHEHKPFTPTRPVKLWLRVPEDFDPSQREITVVLEYKRTEDYLFNREWAL
ncbi:MAG: hypothetical protein A2Y38_17375 [Spirochaetes bacterium GWB1_59_5]|nr:MAG: hypothetical protein A2Y38_17375 [Spirochaetes bacterium GWB1_59_5]